MTNREVLQKSFGFDNFKDIQEDVIENLLDGKNSLCLMPTGGGKSIIYQVAGIQTGKTSIVISPLLALMKQQNNRLEEQGIHTLTYNSSLGDLKTQFNRLREVFAQSELPQFIFVSPEKIFSDGYFEYLLKKHRSKIGLIVIDEVHCISQWGHTFRPAYKTIPLFLDNIYGVEKVPPLLCLTATLTPEDKNEICTELKIADKDIFISTSLIRPNLHLHFLDQVEDNEAKKTQLIEILNRHRGEKVIVYTHIKARDYGTREMSAVFKAMGFNCHYFDADMQDDEKLRILEQFEKGELRIVFATSAFGMGIDIPDIRVVVHYLVPESIEQYYQEVGRAGRDGLAAYGYLLHSAINFKIRRDLIKKSVLKPERIQAIYDNTVKPTSRLSSTASTKQLDEADIGSKVYSLSKDDIREDNSELIVFLYLLVNGIVRLHGKGLQFFHCFENSGAGEIFDTMSEASVNGLVKRIAKKLKSSIEELNNDIFKMFDAGLIRLSKSPSNVLNYSVERELSENDVEAIHNAMQIRTDKRLEHFERLVTMIDSKADPIQAIADHLGVS